MPNESADVHKLRNYLREYIKKSTYKRLIALKCTLLGLCLDFIVVHKSKFNLQEIPSELKEKIDQYKIDKELFYKN